MSTTEANQHERVTLVSTLLKVVHTLPPQQHVAVLEKLKGITGEAKAIEIDLEEEERKSPIDERLARIRRDLRKDVSASGWRRLLELAESHVAQRLNTLTKSQEMEHILKSLDHNLAEFDAAIAKARQIPGVPLTGAGEPITRTREQEEDERREIIEASAQIERSFQRSRRRMLNPFRLAMHVIKLEAARWGATLFRLGTMLGFGMMIFLIAGLVHELHPNDETWYVSLVLIPFAVAAAEFVVHRVGDWYFEQWAHRDRGRLNGWLMNARMIVAVDEAMAEFARKPIRKPTSPGLVDRGDKAH